jgi:RNA polymerase sigma factor (sigma-70 family)
MMRSPIPANIARALRRTPSLSATEERDLFRKVHSGDTRARERLVLSQLRYVIRIAGRYRRYGCPLSDLIQEGTVGLLEAIKRFNPEKGNRLSTFAMWWIRAAIQDYVLRSGSVVRSVTTPRHRTMYFNGALAGLDEKGGDAVRALASRLNTTVDDVRSFAQRLTSSDHPLDAPRSDGRTLADTLPSFGTGRGNGSRIQARTDGTCRYVAGGSSCPDPTRAPHHCAGAFLAKNATA